LFIGNAAYIIPGISAANSGGGGETGITAHSCGTANVHNSEISYGTMTDQEGNVYRTVVIGNQEWMAENLKTSIYRNGQTIATNLTDLEWQNLITGAWSSYNDDSQFDCPYGKLYNWYAVADPRNVCPTGWHVPTDVEWSVLTDYLGGSVFSGGKMKSTSSWNAPNSEATNESGFSCLPAGLRTFDGTFSSMGVNGFLWSSNEYDTNSAWLRDLSYENGYANRNFSAKRHGFSVRCLRD
jgi:uncharacterized protein (TIGR02145 family)